MEPWPWLEDFYLHHHGNLLRKRTDKRVHDDEASGPVSGGPTIKNKWKAHQEPAPLVWWVCPEKTHAARFCLNESQPSNSFQRKGEGSQEGEWMLTEFHLPGVDSASTCCSSTVSLTWTSICMRKLSAAIAASLTCLTESVCRSTLIFPSGKSFIHISWRSLCRRVLEMHPVGTLVHDYHVFFNFEEFFTPQKLNCVKMELWSSSNNTVQQEVKIIAILMSACAWPPRWSWVLQFIQWEKQILWEVIESIWGHLKGGWTEGVQPQKAAGVHVIVLPKRQFQNEFFPLSWHISFYFAITTVWSISLMHWW